MIVSITLHWLISQSVFVIQSIGMAYGTEFYRYPVNDSSLIGYSNIGIIYSFSSRIHYDHIAGHVQQLSAPEI